MRLLGSLCGLLVVVGCAAEGDDIDGASDRYIVDGKADTGGVQEGTPEAAAILHVASTWSRADLGGDVGLAAKAADNVLAYRSGDDETAGTADDEAFESLAELDAVPFMGPLAFGKLLAYAQANDLVGDIPVVTPVEDPFDPASCQGAPMSHADADARWAARQGRLGTYQLAIRKRTCTGADASTCGAWAPKPIIELDWRNDASGFFELRKYDGEIRLVMQARTCRESSYYGADSDELVGASCDGIGHDLYCYSYNISRRCGAPTVPADNLTVDGTFIEFTGTLTENCVRLVSTKSRALSNGSRAEYQTAVLERF